MALDKVKLDTLLDKNTVVIIPEFGEENKIALKYLRKHASKVVSEQRVYTELVMSTLQTDISVVTVARNYANPIKLSEIDKAGMLNYPRRPDSELEDEVEVSAPIKVSKYWVRDNPMRPGRPDTAGILEAIGKESIPWRLDFVDKGAEKPEVLVLRKG